MKNIITAIGNEDLNNILKKYNQVNVLYKDIQYEEGINEILNTENNVDLLIISDDILLNKNIFEIVNEIILIKKEIEIIIIFSKKLEIDNLYKIKNIKKIILKDDNYVLNILNLILENNEINYASLKKENSADNKEINIKNIINNNISIINKIKNKLKRKKINNVFTVLGCPGVGKTIFIGILAKIYAEKGQKVLLIDLDFKYKNLHILFRKKKYPKLVYKKLNNEEFINEFKLNESNLNKLKVKINKNIDLISSADIIFDENYIINNERINNLFNILKEKYNIILIDTNSEEKLSIMQQVINNSNKIVYLIEDNLLQLSKAKQKLLDYIENYKIEKERINIICNKRQYLRKKNFILKIIFKKVKIIRYINYSKEYEKLINSNLKKEIPKKIKKDYIYIIKELSEGEILRWN